MSLLDCLHAQIRLIFEEHPYRFFTEHDIHSELARIATEALMKEGKLYAETSDHHKVGRVHHEYPTPFRCDMRGYDFRVVTEEEFNLNQQEGVRTRARRGFIDLAVLNPDFISSNKLVIVSGKKYKEFLEDLKHQKYPALDLAVEVVYHPTFDKKIHVGIMQNKVASTIQDYQKLVALTRFKLPSGMPFCKEAAMFFFSNTPYTEELNGIFKRLAEDKVKCFKILYSNAC